MTEKLTELNFFDAFKHASNGLKIRHIGGNKNTSGQWLHILPNKYGITFINDPGECFDWKTLARQQNWEVKTKKPDEIFVWGVCDDDGEINIFFTENCWKHKDGCWTAEEDSLTLNLFSKDKPQKLRLVPADEMYSPFRKFDKEKMPDETFQIVVITKDGNLHKDRWERNKLGLVDEIHVLYYCPFPLFENE